MKFLLSLVFFFLSLLFFGCARNLENDKKELIKEFKNFIKLHNSGNLQELKAYLPSEVYNDKEKLEVLNYMTRFARDQAVEKFEIDQDFIIDTLGSTGNFIYARISYTSLIYANLARHLEYNAELMSLTDQLTNDSIFFGPDNISYNDKTYEEIISLHKIMYCRKNSNNPWEIFPLSDETGSIIPVAFRL